MEGTEYIEHTLSSAYGRPKNKLTQQTWFF
jgi:hypothetical protein